MSTVGIVSIVVIVLVAIILGVLLMVVLKKQNRPEEKSKTNTPQSKPLTIEDLIDIVADRNSTKNDLSNALLKVSTSFPFPQKRDNYDALTQEQKKYLNFVLLLSSHKNADAKLIAYMDKELKSKNPKYENEIDIYENEGLNQRKNRT